MRLKNKIAMGFGAFRANAWGSKNPLSVMLSVTNRCHSRCVYCGIPSRQQREMTTEEMLRLVDEMGAAGVQKLSLWGGEPLLRTDLGRIIGRAKECGMYVNCDSNGYLVPEKFDVIKDLDFLILSFDGEKEVHDRNREGGALEKFFRAVESIGGKIPVWTLTVLTKHNIDSLDYILEKAREFGFQTMFQVPYHPRGIGSGEDVLAGTEDYRKAFRRLLELKRQGAPVISSSRYLELVAEWPFFPETTRDEKVLKAPRCWAGKLFCNIDTNGDMYPCSPSIGRVEPVNVLEKGFSNAFRELEPQACRSCLSACCVEANLVFSWDPWSVREWLKIV